jgi:hypothetical protein
MSAAANSTRRSMCLQLQKPSKVPWSRSPCLLPVSPLDRHSDVGFLHSVTSVPFHWSTQHGWNLVDISYPLVSPLSFYFPYLSLPSSSIYTISSFQCHLSGSLWGGIEINDCAQPECLTGVHWGFLSVKDSARGWLREKYRECVYLIKPSEMPIQKWSHFLD